MSEVEEILFLELEGLSKTIGDVTRDNYILSYARKLGDQEFPKDLKIIHILCERLYEWYEKEIDDILANEYIPNTNSHLKSMRILKEIIKLTE